MTALITGAPKPSEPSRWTLKMNGCEDKIHGYDDGEVMARNPEPYVFGDEIAVFEELEASKK
jgi:hypothetical protein